MVVINRELIEQAVEAMDEYEPMRISPSYSGRGMSGATCLGLTGTQSDFLRVLIELASKDKELAIDLTHRVRTDSMGMSTIFYFPGVSLSDQE